MPLNETSGNVTADAYAGGVAVLPKYIEDYFSAYLYTGNGANRSINNGIDLSTKGGMTWFKCRNVSGINNLLFDTSRGVGNFLRSDTTNAQTTASDTLTAFNTDGFSLGVDSNDWGTNFSSSRNYVSWTWAKAPKFFDVVTYTGNGASNRAISHNLGSTPGCFIVKRTDTGGTWAVWHTSLGNDYYLALESTQQAYPSSILVRSATSTTFSVGSDATVNASGGTYVCYLFAHNAGGFGLTGTDNVISCGSYTTDGAGSATINLGYEAQYVMIKSTAIAGQWWIADAMRGFSNSSTNLLQAQSSGAEYNDGNVYMTPTATGFTVNNWATSNPFIYIAIRRGPMKVPTVGTSVYNAVGYTATNVDSRDITNTFPPDFAMVTSRSDQASWVTPAVYDRLRGNGATIATNSTAAEAGVANTSYQGYFSRSTQTITGVTASRFGTWGYSNYSGGDPWIAWYFKRAPSFFDEVCYTGTGSATTFNHNLGAVPELIFIKRRDNGAFAGRVYHKDLGNTYWLYLFYSGADASIQGPSSSVWNSTTPTSTVFSVGTDGGVNASGSATVAYLFATCAGVSKVFSFTGNGSTQAIACGFTGGARFVIIKATSTTGNWLVFDTARGMTTSTDPWLALNLTSAESATSGACTTTTGGFTVDESKLTGVNTNGVSYIGLAVA